MLFIKNTDTLIEQTRAKPPKTLECKIDGTTDTELVDTSLLLENIRWILGLTNLKVYFSVSEVTNETSISEYIFVKNSLGQKKLFADENGENSYFNREEEKKDETSRQIVIINLRRINWTNKKEFGKINKKVEERFFPLRFILFV